jgi:uncharacterized protein (TIGR00255 family)
MTGYGRGQSQADGLRVIAEGRSTNHRYADIVPRLPRSLLSIEDRVRRLVGEYVSRGRVDVTISVESTGLSLKTVKADTSLASEYMAALSQLGDTLGIAAPVPLTVIASLPDVLSIEDKVLTPDEAWPIVSSALSQCMQSLSDMRLEEGSRLSADVAKRMSGLEKELERIESRASLVVDEYRQKIGRRLSDMIPSSAMDEPRLSLEIALLAERSNITEETVRLRSHISQAGRTLESEGAVGRKLDFILQEMNREINTIASKSTDLGISESCVTIKSELEKIREQIQNLE